MLLFLTGEQAEPSYASESSLLADMRQTQHSHPLKLEQKQTQSKSPQKPSELQSLSGKTKQALCSFCQSTVMSFV